LSPAMTLHPDCADADKPAEDACGRAAASCRLRRSTAVFMVTGMNDQKSESMIWARIW
jgi:hypothetical protein